MVDAITSLYSQLRSMQETRYNREVSEGTPAPHRVFRPHRQRSRLFSAEDSSKDRLPRRVGKAMPDASESASRPTEGLLDRQTLCLPDFADDSILHVGNDGFTHILQQHFATAESNASERLVHLKTRLRKASTHDFWALLLEEMCEITGAQCGLVAKRMLVDDQDSAVEMPELGEEGSCLMGVAFYMNSGDTKELKRDYRYTAFGTPCAYMKYDKVFIVPERMSEVTPNNPNAMPWGQSEAFIGVPLMMDDKSFAHFALIWSKEGAKNRRLSWSFLEMFMHTLEDMILQRIIEGRGFAKDAGELMSSPAKIIPLAAITASQSLKPYARSLSHELRTPMQGVIGMLDIMYSTVTEAIDQQDNESVRCVFEDLKTNIEIVQDSSKRAVEAADNVVHAYDLNMQMPEPPPTPDDSDGNKPFSPTSIDSEVRISGKRSRPADFDFNLSPPPKRTFTLSDNGYLSPNLSSEPCTMSTEPSEPLFIEQSVFTGLTSGIQAMPNAMTFDHKNPLISSPASIGPVNQRIITRDFMRNVIKGTLKTDYPSSEHHVTTDLGESIVVTTQGPRGEIEARTIELVIEPEVPEAIITEEQTLHFSISKVIDNAIKFTDDGSIKVTVKLNNLQTLEIWVLDTGCGITEKSKPRLFQPHFQENANISRAKDGLGLSLFNAKAHVRKNLGGDITLVRSTTNGPSQGSEFLIRVPISTLDLRREVTPLVGTSPDSQSAPVISPSALSPAILMDRKITSRRGKAPNVDLARQYPLNILIAEDNPVNRMLIVKFLESLGYKGKDMTLAFNGREAVDYYRKSLLQSKEHRYDIIFMDIWMPIMDGYEATREILNLAKASGESATIVAVTADITNDCLTRSREAGMINFIKKPCGVLNIEKVIIEHCGTTKV